MREVRVAVGTQSLLKLRAVKTAFASLGLSPTTEPHEVISGVRAQPFGLKEMKKGATTRRDAALAYDPTVDFALGIESGLFQQDEEWFDAICISVSKCGGGQSTAYSASFPIPEWIVQTIMRKRSELGEIARLLAGGGEKDALKYLSDDSIKREEILAEGIKCALTPLIHADRYALRYDL